MDKKIIVIGSGFASLSAACYLAKAGNKVTLYEKNASVGGRARRLSREGFHFDIGPTWYWMPGVFEKFFADFGKQVSDYYVLEKLAPAYDVYFQGNEKVTIDDHLDAIAETFENIEAGSAKKLRSFIKEAQDNYAIAVDKMVYKPGNSPLELVTPETITRVGQFFSTISKEVRKRFKNEKLIKILEFPVLFLGAKPSDTPSFYSFMNFADFGLGTWHPKKGMYAVVEAMQNLAEELGVDIHTNATVSKILVKDGKAIGVHVNGSDEYADIVVSGADYHHSEQLLDKKNRMYSEAYWDKKIFAPSSLLFYVGFDKKLENVSHHTLFFDTPFEPHAKEIYDTKVWPKEPLFYASFPSKTDAFFAPEGKEAATFLIPIAPGLEDTEVIRKQYFDIIIDRLEKITQQSVKQNVIFVESYCVNDFIKDYNSYKGNAYGLANILTQTAFLRPKIKSRKVQNLFFTGQLTVPGPGVPPSLISGKIVSEQIIKEFSS
ncbi:NAD(P)/FAD-dependent oxidoreductase [Flavobacterium sp. NRK F7]|uniref:phytoene desaturase family protein n=1 Tax=Flavobacterium sp. NRK F7 TaxID=2954930 RepID=UPI0020916500|nr:phytoene desaturase family protein [Flavobacterium sp. NRK F7]MCO6164185.1 phytoene desaturase family protein [Flavobacterium sp. NRK F7]